MSQLSRFRASQTASTHGAGIHIVSPEKAAPKRKASAASIGKANKNKVAKLSERVASLQDDEDEDEVGGEEDVIKVEEVTKGDDTSEPASQVGRLWCLACPANSVS